MSDVKFIAPAGYGEIVPLDRRKHGKLGVKEQGRYAFAGKLNAIYLNTPEFLQAARHYPIVFTHDEERNEYSPLVITALSSGDNLFVDENGDWDADCYVPAYVRRYPFCVAEVKRTEDGPIEQLICVDPEGLTESGERIFDRDGDNTPEWDDLQTFIKDVEKARRQTMRFTEALKEQDLFQVFEAKAFHKSGAGFHLRSMYRVSEERLKELPADILQEFVKRDYLYGIYLHIMSLDNFRKLLDRSMAAGTAPLEEKAS